MSQSTKRKKRSTSGRVYEIVSSGLVFKTRDPLRTLKKLADKGDNAYIRLPNGSWLFLWNEEIAELLEKGETTGRIQLEPPGFRGTKAYMMVRVTKDMFE
jgi:hypothetical protein